MEYINWWVYWLFGLFTSAIMWLVKKYKYHTLEHQKITKLIEDLHITIHDLKNSVRESNVVSLREKLRFMADRYIERGYITEEEKISWMLMYDNYKKDNGNTFIDGKKEEIELLPVAK